MMYWRVRKRLLSTLAPSFTERDFALADVHQLMDACWRAVRSAAHSLCCQRDRDWLCCGCRVQDACAVFARDPRLLHIAACDVLDKRPA